MLIAVLSGFLIAPFAPLLYRPLRHYTGWVLALLPLALTLYFASLVGRVSDGEVLRLSYAWVPSLGVNLSFALDGLGLIFALLVSGIGTLVFLYAQGYLHGAVLLGRFYLFLLMFMASMLGVVLADDIILLFVFWELTSISSYFLISYYHEREVSRDAARTALIVTGASGLAMFAGLVLLAIISGTGSMAAMDADSIRAHALYLPALVLVVVGAFGKSAQFPFHFWLPGAMEAPAPVSAYLHSATMVKAGIYLLARLHPTLGGTDEWHVLVAGGGGITMLLGGWVAWQQTDLKRILAYTTISALGIIVFLLGIGTGTAIKGALLFLVVHALYKAALFMVGGTLDHETGTRDITQLGGLATALPITAGAAALAALSMAGIPPLIGFIGKEVIYEATQHAEDMPILLLTAVAVLANVFNVTAAGMVAITPFWGAKVETPKHPHEAPASMWIGPLVLGACSLVLGLLAGTLLQPLLAQGVGVVYGKDYPVELDMVKMLTHVSTSLLLSIITVLLGAGLYMQLGRLRPLAAPFDIGARVGPARAYTLLMDGILRFAKLQSEVIITAPLRVYIRFISGFFVCLVVLAISRENALGQTLEQLKMPVFRLHELAILVLIVAATWVVVQQRSRLAAVVALGVIGYGVALIYILFGAPDLAMTQFSIETLTVILFVLVIYRLPRFKPLSDRQTRTIDGVIAASVGAVMTTLVLVITSEPLQSRITPYLAENSYLEGKGRNVVNVILVDFRGIDTMGEITVLAIAAIGVFALLTLSVNEPEKKKKD